MRLAAESIPRRLDAEKGYRPWFLIRGEGGIPAHAEHASWDLGDMTGRYLEGLIAARRMGITSPDLSLAEGRLGRYLLGLLGPDGLVHDPDAGAVDHTFSQGSALHGLVAWYEDSGDPAVRDAALRLVRGLLARLERRGGDVIDPTVKLPEASGSHLAGYAIWPACRLHERTGAPEALELAEGLSRWVLADPVLGPGGEITKALSWEGDLHAWLEALAGCARTARSSRILDRKATVERARALHDWVRRTNATSFGWIATFPGHGSSETSAIGSATAWPSSVGCPGTPVLADVERFVRNQAAEAQFRLSTRTRAARSRRARSSSAASTASPRRAATWAPAAARTRAPSRAAA